MPKLPPPAETFCLYLAREPRFQLTVKFVVLVTPPPFVIMEIWPVAAPVGTVAVIWVSEFTVKEAEVPSKATFVAWVRPAPVITTVVPTGPPGGLKVLIVGVTLNVCLLVSLLAPVVTVTGPVRAPDGTIAVR